MGHDSKKFHNCIMLSKSVQRIGSGILHNPLNGKPANSNARRWVSGQGKRMSATIQDFHW